MTVKHVLKEALTVVSRDHAAISRGLAVDQHGQVVDPLSPAAVAWTTAGALIKVAPSHADPPALRHTVAAAEAYDLLEVVAAEHGYQSPAAVDCAGLVPVQRMFWRALNLIEPPARRRRRAPAPGTGAQPRGVVAS